MATRKDAKKKPRATAEEELPLGRVKCSVCGNEFDEGEVVVLTDAILCEKHYEEHVEKQYAAAVADAEAEAAVEADALEAEESSINDVPPAPRYPGTTEEPEVEETIKNSPSDIIAAEPAAPERDADGMQIAEEAAVETPPEITDADTPTLPATREEPPTGVSERIGPGAAVLRAETRLAKRQRSFGLNWYSPRNIEEALATCKLLFRSRLLPDDIKNPEAALLIMMAGAELGFKPTQSFRFLYLVNNRPSLMAGGIMAIIAASPECESFEPVVDKCDETQATYETKRRGRQPQRVTFTAADAERAGLPKRNQTYRAHPTLMYHARAQAILGRRVYADLLGGYYLPDEVAEGFDRDDRDVPSSSYEKIKDAIESAMDQETLSYVASNAQAAMADGHITQAEYDGIAALYEARIAELKEEK